MNCPYQWRGLGEAGPSNSTNGECLPRNAANTERHARRARRNVIHVPTLESGRDEHVPLKVDLTACPSGLTRTCLDVCDPSPEEKWGRLRRDFACLKSQYYPGARLLGTENNWLPEVGKIGISGNGLPAWSQLASSLPRPVTAALTGLPIFHPEMRRYCSAERLPLPAFFGFLLFVRV